MTSRETRHNRSFHLFSSRNQKSDYLVLGLALLVGSLWANALLSLVLSVLPIHGGVGPEIVFRDLLWAQDITMIDL